MKLRRKVILSLMLLISGAVIATLPSIASEPAPVDPYPCVVNP